MNTERYTLGPAKGLDQRWRGGASAAQTAQDLSWDPRGGWRTGPGYRRVLLGQEDQADPGSYVDPFDGLGIIWSLHAYSQGIGARQWILFEADNEGDAATLYALNPSKRTAQPYDALVDRDGNTIDGRAVITTPWLKTTSTAWGNWIYLFNAVDPPIVFDGEMVDACGYAAGPPAPSVREIAATTATYYNNTPTDDGQVPSVGIGPVQLTPSDPALTHQRRYRVSYINDRGQESPLSEPSSTVEVRTGSSGISAGRNFHYMEVPKGPTGTVARRVYATTNIVDADGNVVTGRGDLYFYLFDIEDNDTLGIEIHLDDDQLASEAVDGTVLGGFPTGVRFAFDFKGCLFVVTADSTELLYSNPLAPEVFGLNNRIPIGDARLGPITGGYVTRDSIVILKSKGVFIVKGDPSTGFAADTFDHTHGTDAARSVIEIPGVGLAWLSSDGVSILEGALNNEGVPTRVRSVGVPIYEDIRTWNTSAMVNAHAAAFPREHEIIWWIPTNGDTQPSHCLVFHTDVGEWTTREGFPAVSSMNTPDENADVYFGSWDYAAHPGIHAISRGFNDKDGDAIEPIYETVDIDFGAIFRSCNVKSVLVNCIGFASNMLTLDYKVARNLTYVRANEGADPQEEQQQYPEGQNRMKVYAADVNDYADPDGLSEVAIWDVDTWGLWRPVVLRFDVETSNVAPTHEFAAKLTPGTDFTLMEILSIDIELQSGGLLKTIPLNKLGAADR